MIHPHTKIKELLEISPLIESILFHKYQLGFKTNFYLTDTLEEVFQKNQISHLLESAIQELKEILEIEKKIQITPYELKKLLEKEEVILLDVREEFERAIANIKNSLLLTKELAEEILSKWDKNTKMIFYCHTGVRSLHAAFYFYKQGFFNVKNLLGGIDLWAREIDQSLALY